MGSSSAAYVDPEKLQEFAQQLKAYATFIDNSMAQVRSDLGQLGESWRDHEYEAFREALVRTQRLLKEFAEETRRTEALLVRDAEAAKASRIRLP